jgi:Fic family protein
MEAMGFNLQGEANLHTLTSDLLKSSEIEGEILNLDQVRSSIARRLGIDIPGLIPAGRHGEIIVEMMLDATRNYHGRLNYERLFSWHAAMFPTGRRGMTRIAVRNYRNNSNIDPMQVVSGPFSRPRFRSTRIGDE